MLRWSNNSADVWNIADFSDQALKLNNIEMMFNIVQEFVLLQDLCNMTNFVIHLKC